MANQSLPRRSLLAGLTLAPLLGACSSSDPFASNPAATGSGTSGAGGPVTVGSANFPESEIIGELYAQALEAKGRTVQRRMQIGAREVYLSALAEGSIDLIAEYTGNLLGYYDKSATPTGADEVAEALAAALPAEFALLDIAQAEDKDSYNVTAEFSTKHGITSLADLAGYPGTLRIGGNPELAQRDYGPGLVGLTRVYGVPAERMAFTPISDGGGPLTIRALAKGDVDLANIFSTTPAIKEQGFVTLEDPKHLITPQNVVPLVAKAKLDDDLASAINAVQRVLTTDDLLAMNGRNAGDEKAQPRQIAADWLKSKGLV